MDRAAHLFEYHYIPSIISFELIIPIPGSDGWQELPEIHASLKQGKWFGTEDAEEQSSRLSHCSQAQDGRPLTVRDAFRNSILDFLCWRLGPYI